MELRFPIWKPALSNRGPSRVRIQESYSNLLDRMHFGQLLLNMARHVTPSVLSNCVRLGGGASNRVFSLDAKSEIITYLASQT